MSGAILAAAASVIIPGAFTGDWAIERYGCESGDPDAHLAIRPDSLSSAEESKARIDQAALLSSRRLELRYTLLFSEESIETTSIFTLSSDGQELTEESRNILNGKPFLRKWVRCG